jgi:uncharacterized protein YqjF (DUF2071 family)
MLFDLVSLRIQVRNFALVNYAVDADRVRQHLPAPYELQTFSDTDRDYCFVSASCFCNQDFRLAASPYPRHTFNESTYRTYVTHNGDAGVYFFTRFLGTPISVVPQRMLARDTYLADFEVTTELDQSGYRSYVCDARGPDGQTTFSLEARSRPKTEPPFASGEEVAQFFTYRLRGYFTSSVGTQVQMPVSHPPMNPYAGQLDNAYLEPFARLGIVPADEMNAPHSVLVQPEVDFRLHPPRPVLPAENVADTRPDFEARFR